MTIENLLKDVDFIDDILVCERRKDGSFDHIYIPVGEAGINSLSGYGYLGKTVKRICTDHKENDTIRIYI